MAENFKAPLCKKAQHHQGEVISLVCLERACSHQCVICDLCYEEEHNGHKIRPLKSILKNASKYLKVANEKQPNFKAKQNLGKMQEALMKDIYTFEKAILQSLMEIKQSIGRIFQNLEYSMISNGGKRNLLQTLETLTSKQMPLDAFTSFVQTIITQVPLEFDSSKVKMDIPNDKLQTSSINFCQRLSDQCIFKKNQICSKMKAFSSELATMSLKEDLLSTFFNYTFNPELKHQEIAILENNIVKSMSSDSYRFAMLSPQLNPLTTFKCSFRIVKKASSWLGVGVCYKNRIISSKYNFDYLSANHGGYLLSSNAGYWSQINSSLNGTFGGFAFGEGDRIVVTYSPKQKIISFSKLGSSEKKQIPFQARPDDQLHLCALFYYKDDQIQFEGEFKE